MAEWLTEHIRSRHVFAVMVVGGLVLLLLAARTWCLAEKLFANCMSRKESELPEGPDVDPAAETHKMAELTQMTEKLEGQKENG